jgi:hypothetical protein
VDRTDGLLEVFAIAQDHSVWTATQSSPGSASWGSWSQVGTKKFAAKEIAVGSNANGRLQVFAIPFSGGAGQVWTTSVGDHNTWGAWQQIPLKVGMQHIYVASQPNGLQVLFGIDVTGAVWAAREKTANNNTWNTLTNLSARPAQQLAIGTRQDGSLEVFMLQSGNGAVSAVTQTAPNGDGWSKSTNLKAPVGMKSIQVAQDVDVGLEVICLGKYQSAWVLASTVRKDDFSDSRWFSLGGKFTSLSVGMDRQGNFYKAGLDIFGVDPTGVIDVAQQLANHTTWT